MSHDELISGLAMGAFEDLHGQGMRHFGGHLKPTAAGSDPARKHQNDENDHDDADDADAAMAVAIAIAAEAAAEAAKQENNKDDDQYQAN
jgi:hypothetical protein